MPGYKSLRILCLLLCQSLALAGQETFSRQYDFINNDFASDLFVEDSVMHVFGFSRNSMNHKDEMHLILDHHGEILSSEFLSDSSEIFEIARFAEHGDYFYFFQNHYNFYLDTANWDDFVTKVHKETGEIMFEKRLGLPYRTENGNNSIYDQNHRLITVGWEFNRDFTIQSEPTGSILLQSADTFGNLQWRQVYPRLQLGNYYGRGVAPTSENGFIIAGHNLYQYQAPGTASGFRVTVGQAILLRTDSMGNEIARSYFPEQIENYARGFVDIVQYSDSLYIACGDQADLSDLPFYPDYNLDSLSFLAMAFTPDLEPVWEIVLDTLSLATWQKIKKGQDGNLILTGQYARDKRAIDIEDGVEDTPSTQGLLTLMSPQGEVLWHRNYVISPSSITASNFIQNVAPHPDGGYVAVGFAHTPVDIGRNQNMWVLKVDEHGCVVPGCQEVITSVEEIDLSEPSDKTALRAFPNPTLDDVQIQWKEPRALLSYHILSSSGKVIEEVQFARIEAVSSIRVPMWDYPAGLYEVALRFADGWQVTKVVKQ